MIKSDDKNIEDLKMCGKKGRFRWLACGPWDHMSSSTKYKIYGGIKVVLFHVMRFYPKLSY